MEHTQSGGFKQIPNDLFRAMYQAGLTGTELSVLLFVFEQTTGYNQATRVLTCPYIAKGTVRNERTVEKSVSSLIAKKILVSDSSKPHTQRKLGINTDTQKWCTKNGLQDTQKRVTEHPKTGNNIIKSINKEIERKRTPDFLDVRNHFMEHGFSDKVAKDFFNYYDGIGWKKGNTYIEKWEVFADRWMKREKDNNTAAGQNRLRRRKLTKEDGDW